MQVKGQDGTKVISLRLDDKDYWIIARQAKRSKLTISDYVRKMVMEHHAGAHGTLDDLLQWIEASRRALLDEGSIIVKKVGLTEDDKDLIDAWKLTYMIPQKARVFYPAIKTTVDAARAAGLSQEALLEFIEASPQDRWFAECVRNGRPPTLPQLLTTNALDRLSQLVMLKTIKKESMVDAGMPVLRAQGARILHELAHDARDADIAEGWYACLDGATTKKEIDELLADVVDHIGGDVEERISRILGGTDVDQEEEG